MPTMAFFCWNRWARKRWVLFWEAESSFLPKSTWCSVQLRKMMIFHYPYFCRKPPTMILILPDSCPSKLFHPISLPSFPESLRCQRTQKFLRLEIYQTVQPEMIDATNEWIPSCGLLVRLLCIKRKPINSVCIYIYTLSPQLDLFKAEDTILWPHRVFAKTCQNKPSSFTHFRWISSWTRFQCEHILLVRR